MSDLRLRAVAVAVAVPAVALAMAGATPAAAAAAHPPHPPLPHGRQHDRARGRAHDRVPQALPLYARPADASAVVGRLASGDRFTTHQTEGGWTFIHDRTNRAEGWAHFTHPHHTAQPPRTPDHDRAGHD